MHNRVIVSGKGEVSAAPDRAEVGLSISVLEPEALLAQEKAAHATAQVLEALLGLGLSEKDIETSSYWINPEYAWENNSRVFQGYKAQNTLKINVSDLSLVNRIIDTAIKTGGREVDYVHFRSSRKDELEQEALARAAQKARSRAAAIAEGLGARLGMVVRVSERTSSGGYYRPYFVAEYSRAKEDTSAHASTTVIKPDAIKVTAAVEAVFQLVTQQG